ncbi:MAG: DNA polymerase IV [Acidobacteriota bacterium]
MTHLIFHVDMDAFFVSVEELFNPDLKGKAVVVGGDPDQRGVVSAASYEARKFGVHSAMPLVTAKRLCPHAIFLHGHRQRYADYSRRVNQILLEFSPIVEMASIDEAYLDLTGTERLYGNAMSLAHRLRATIQQRTGLSASIGVSSSRLVSKVASDLAKPKGILRVLPGKEAVFLSPLPVSKIPGIGKVTEKRLRELGITTVSGLASAGRRFLTEAFGQWGEALYRKSIGLETAHFEWHEEPRSISHEHTFEVDTADAEILERTLVELVQRVAHRLRDHKMFAHTVTLKLRDWRFNTITRASSLAEETQLDQEILAKARSLLHDNWDGRQRIRLVGVALTGLTFGPLQPDLFEKARRERMTRVYEAVDKVRDKFGFDSVIAARTVE